jgi:hypothetical protein
MISEQINKTQSLGLPRKKWKLTVDIMMEDTDVYVELVIGHVKENCLNYDC